MEIKKSFKIKSFKLSDHMKREAGIKEIVDKAYTWIKDKLKSEDSTELEIREELEDQVEEDISEDEEIAEEDTGLLKKIVDKVVTTLKDEGSLLVVEEGEEEEEPDEEGFEGEKDLLDLIKESAKNRNLIWIKYRDRFGEITEREVEPWEIRDAYYMFAHDPDFTPHHGSDIGTRQFIMAAILEYKATDKPYENSDRWEMRIK